jgi:hypothetical protein
MAIRAAASLVDQVPDSLLVEILKKASSVNQQQQEEDQPFLISTRKQQCYLCGIFTLVSHRWRMAALSACTGLDITVTGSSQNAELLSSWLLRNGSTVQHLCLRFKINPLPLLSTLPTSTPQLKCLRVSGLFHLHKFLPAEAAAAWGALSSLTSLEIDILSSLAPAVKQLPNLVELSVTSFLAYYNMTLVPALPQLQVLRLPAFDLYRSADIFAKQELVGLSSMQQLQHVDNIRVDSADLTHPFVMSKCYPSILVVISATDRTRDIAEWVQRGGGKQVMDLVISSRGLKSSVKPSIAYWLGFTALRSLELIHLDLSPGLQQLRGLTQLTHLTMDNCSPDIHSLGQLPPCLCSLSLDNLRWNAALHEQQQQQQASCRSVPQLPNLTRLVLSGDSAVSSAGRMMTAFLDLQQFVLKFTASALGSMLHPLSQLTSLSSLTVSYLGAANTVLEGVLVLSKFPALQQLEVSEQVISPLNGLEIAATLGHLTAVKVIIEGPLWRIRMSCGDLLQVRNIRLVQRFDIVR